MRYEKKIGNLEPDRVKALEDLDFKWALRQTDTQDFLGRLKSFKELHGVGNERFYAILIYAPTKASQYSE